MNRKDLLKETTREEENDRIVVPLTFHPSNLKVAKVIRDRFGLLENDDEVGGCFERKKPMMAYRRDKNLKDILVRARLKAQSGSESGTVKCDRIRCYTCNHVSSDKIVVGPRGTFVIRESFSCVSSELIYAIECKKCGELYVGETSHRLGDRFVEHRRNVQNNVANNEIAAHFNQENHNGIQDMTIKGLKYCSDTWTRKIEEQRIISRLGCVLGQGMNVDFIFPQLMN